MKKLLLLLVFTLLNICAATAQFNPVIRVTYELPQTIEIEVGQTVDLMQYLTIDPSNYQLSANARWEYSNSASFIKVENNKLTGLAVTGGAYLALQIPFAASQVPTHDYYSTVASTTVVVKEVTPTAINIKNDHLKITVGVGETDKLTKFLSEAYTFTPANAVGTVTWSSADQTIVKPEGYWGIGQVYTYKYTPLKVGTTTMTASLGSSSPFGPIDVPYGNGQSTTPAITSKQKVEVTVIQPVTDILINPSLNLHECNVGDNLGLYLKAITTVKPNDATNKAVKWSVVRGDQDAVTINSDGSAKAVKSGTVYLQVASVSNPEVTNIIGVRVHNPATDVKFAKNVIDIDYQGTSIDISQQIKDNITFLPQGCEEVSNLSVKSDREDLVKISQVSYKDNLNLSAFALGSGDATITVSFSYLDYIDGGRVVGDNIPSIDIEKTFKVHLGINVSQIVINSGNNVEECNVGDDLTNYLNSIIKVLPANAPDKSVTWKVLRGDAVTVDNAGNIKAVKAGTTSLEVTSVSNPQVSTVVTVRVHNPAKDIQLKSNTLSVEYVDKFIDISNDIRENLSFLPADYESVDGFTLTSDNSEVVNISMASYTTNGLQLLATALAPGTANITVSIRYQEYMEGYLDPTSPEHYTTVTKTFKFVVSRGFTEVESLRNKSERQSEECNVGDDLTAHLNSLIEVLPADATNQHIEWTLPEGNAVDAVTISRDGTIKAVKAGYVTLLAYSASNPQATASVTVQVHNPATDIQFVKDLINVTYGNSPIDISKQVEDNIKLLPEDHDYPVNMQISSDRPNDVVNAYMEDTPTGQQVKATALGAGEANLMVTVFYRDYLADYADPTRAHNNTVVKQFKVSVIQGNVPVTALRNTSSRQIEECNVGDDLTAHLNSLIAVLPEDATDRTITWSIPPGNAVEAVTISRDGTIKAVKPGTINLMATSNNNPDATTTITVTVHNPATDIQFAEDVLLVTKYQGSDLDISDLLKNNISFLPQGYETVEGLTIESAQPDVVTIDDNSYNDNMGIVLIAHATGDGRAKINVSISYRDYLADYATPANQEHRTTVTKSFNVSVTEEEVTVASVTYPDELVLSRYHDVPLTLGVQPEGVALNSQLVEIRIGESKNNGWGVAATATPTATAANTWNLRGRFVGSYIYKVYYNGQPQLTESGKDEGRLLIPVEYPFERGWDWISLYAVGSSGTLDLKTPTGWVAPMQDGENGVYEIRSQHELLYRDPEFGFFGDIEQLRPEDGMYKIHSLYDDNASSQMVFKAGYDNLTRASSLRLPQARPGYTWITYPHELDHQLSTLAPYLSRSAEAGDMIIGRDAFAFYDGEEWLAPEGFIFQAGKGYMYFTESEQPKTITWGPDAIEPDRTPNVLYHARMATNEVSPWNYDAYAHPDCMAVIARIDGTDTPDDYSVGAFVDDECRGKGSVVSNGLVCAAVSGQAGERVSFRLYHKPTGSYQTVDGTISFAARAGSLQSPVKLHADAVVTGLTADLVLSLSVSSNVVMVSGAVGVPEITVTDMSGRQVARCEGSVLSLSQLPAGVYIVRAADGVNQITKKIKK